MPNTLWLGKYKIASADHEADLEREAASLEFQHRLPREEAEARAWQAYRRQQILQAAAHHLQGMRQAQVAGDFEQGQLHGQRWQQALQVLGHNPWGPVPAEIQALSRSQEKPRLYRFRAHGADTLLD